MVESAAAVVVVAAVVGSLALLVAVTALTPAPAAAIPLADGDAGAHHGTSTEPPQPPFPSLLFDASEAQGLFSALDKLHAAAAAAQRDDHHHNDNDSRTLRGETPSSTLTDNFALAILQGHQKNLAAVLQRMTRNKADKHTLKDEAQGNMQGFRHQRHLNAATEGARGGGGLWEKLSSYFQQGDDGGEHGKGSNLPHSAEYGQGSAHFGGSDNAKEGYDATRNAASRHRITDRADVAARLMHNGPIAGPVDKMKRGKEYLYEFEGPMPPYKPANGYFSRKHVSLQSFNALSTILKTLPQETLLLLHTASSQAYLTPSNAPGASSSTERVAAKALQQYLLERVSTHILLAAESSNAWMGVLKYLTDLSSDPRSCNKITASSALLRSPTPYLRVKDIVTCKPRPRRGTLEATSLRDVWKAFTSFIVSCDIVYPLLPRDQRLGCVRRSLTTIQNLERLTRTKWWMAPYHDYEGTSARNRLRRTRNLRDAQDERHTFGNVSNRDGDDDDRDDDDDNGSTGKERGAAVGRRSDSSRGSSRNYEAFDESADSRSQTKENLHRRAEHKHLNSLHQKGAELSGVSDDVRFLASLQTMYLASRFVDSVCFYDTAVMSSAAQLDNTQWATLCRDAVQRSLKIESLFVKIFSALNIFAYDGSLAPAPSRILFEHVYFSLRSGRAQSHVLYRDNHLNTTDAFTARARVILKNNIRFDKKTDSQNNGNGNGKSDASASQLSASFLDDRVVSLLCRRWCSKHLVFKQFTSPVSPLDPENDAIVFRMVDAQVMHKGEGTWLADKLLEDTYGLDDWRITGMNVTESYSIIIHALLFDEATPAIPPHTMTSTKLARFHPGGVVVLNHGHFGNATGALKRPQTHKDSIIAFQAGQPTPLSQLRLNEMTQLPESITWNEFFPEAHPTQGHILFSSDGKPFLTSPWSTHNAVPTQTICTHHYNTVSFTPHMDSAWGLGNEARDHFNKDPCYEVFDGTCYGQRASCPVYTLRQVPGRHAAIIGSGAQQQQQQQQQQQGSQSNKDDVDDNEAAQRKRRQKVENEFRVFFEQGDDDDDDDGATGDAEGRAIGKDTAAGLGGAQFNMLSPASIFSNIDFATRYHHDLMLSSDLTSAYLHIPGVSGIRRSIHTIEKNILLILDHIVVDAKAMAKKPLQAHVHFHHQAPWQEAPKNAAYSVIRKPPTKMQALMADEGQMVFHQRVAVTTDNGGDGGGSADHDDDDGRGVEGHESSVIGEAPPPPLVSVKKLKMYAAAKTHHWSVLRTYQKLVKARSSSGSKTQTADMLFTPDEFMQEDYFPEMFDAEGDDRTTLQEADALLSETSAGDGASAGAGKKGAASDGASHPTESSEPVQKVVTYVSSFSHSVSSSDSYVLLATLLVDHRARAVPQGEGGRKGQSRRAGHPGVDDGMVDGMGVSRAFDAMNPNRSGDAIAADDDDDGSSHGAGAGASEDDDDLALRAKVVGFDVKCHDCNPRSIRTLTSGRTRVEVTLLYDDHKAPVTHHISIPHNAGL